MASQNLAAWDVKEEDFPASGTMAEQLKFLLSYAVLAPAAHNAQPWRFSIQGNGVAIRADRDRSLPVVDPDDRELHIGLGCALANLLAAAEHFRLGYKVDLLPEGEDSDLAVAVEFTSQTRSPRFPDLLAVIPLRHTNRGKYEGRAIEPDKLLDLERCIDEESIRLHLITEQEPKWQMADLVARGDYLQRAGKSFRRELASWTRHNWTRAVDGMPGYAFGVSGIMALLRPFIVKTFDTGKSQGNNDRQLANQAPALGVLTSSADDKPSWIRTGMLFEKLMLVAAKLDIRLAHFNQPVEVPELRQELCTLLGIEDYPQLLFRLGYASATKHTPRRPVNMSLAA